ncbi:MAG: hypothetical protein KBS65_06340 [Prevotella sp.]|nr:hypothetical protein [Candidatus Equicola stercoris]
MKKIYSKPKVKAIDLTLEGFIAYSAYGGDTPGGGSKKISGDYFETGYGEEVDIE